MCTSPGHAAGSAAYGVYCNTVAARITRIGHLLDVDLSRPDERLARQLAARAVIRADDQ